MTVNVDTWKDTEVCSEEMFHEIVGLTNSLRFKKKTRTIGVLLSMLAESGNIHLIKDKAEERLAAEGLTTAYTDYRSIGVCDQFRKKLTPLGVLFTLLHESCHIAFLHNIRGKDKQRRYWNIAADALINYVVTKVLLPDLTGMRPDDITGNKLFIKGVDPMIIGFTDKTKAWIDSALAGKTPLNIFSSEETTFGWGMRRSEEDFYSQLIRVHRQMMKEFEAMDQNGGLPGGQGGQAGAGGGGAGVPIPGEDEEFDDHDIEDIFKKILEEGNGEDIEDITGHRDDAGGPGGKNGAGGGKGDGKGGKIDNSDREEFDLEAFVKRMVDLARRNSASIGRAGGAGGSGSGGHIDDFINSQFEAMEVKKKARNWQFIVENAVEEACSGVWHQDYNRREGVSQASTDQLYRNETGVCEFHRYDIHRERGKARILVVWDSSASVGMKDKVEFYNEMHNMVASSSQGDGNNPFLELTFVTGDTMLRHSEKFEITDADDVPKVLDIGGGGGTEMFSVSLQALVQADENEPYNLMILLSDGDVNPKNFNYPNFLKNILAISPEKVDHIPAVMVIMTRDSYSNSDLSAALSEFPRGGGLFTLHNGNESLDVTYESGSLNTNAQSM